MKQGWETKKLGEVCKLFTDGDWIESKDQSNKGIRLIQTGNIGCGEFNDKADHYRYISEETFIRLNCTEIYAGDILISRLPDPIGRSCIIPRMPHRMITAVDCTIVRPENIINPNFLVYYTNSRPYQDEINRYVTGAVRKRISRKNLFKIPIPVPPLSEQERIVAELDLLSDVIAKKREQLKQLDTLAQSIFYDMFGDPITNKKGWKTKKLGETSTLHNGRAFKPTDWSNSGLPIVRIQNLNNPTLPFNYYDGEVANNHRLYGGELLYAWSGTPDTSFGAHIWYGGDAVLNQHIFKIEYNKDLLNIKYFVFNLNGIVNSMFDKTHGGVGLQHITKGTLTSQNICLPPLYLQQQFASKIESIEKQKELIKQSLSEVQQLFDSRMDYYFG